MKKAIVLFAVIWVLLPSMVSADKISAYNNLEIEITFKFNKNGDIETVQFGNDAPITDFKPIKTGATIGDLIGVLPIGERITYRDKGGIAMGIHIPSGWWKCQYFSGDGNFIMKLKLEGGMFQPFNIKTCSAGFGEKLPPDALPPTNELLMHGGRGQMIDLKPLGNLLIFKGIDNKYSVQYCSCDNRVSVKPGIFK